MGKQMTRREALRKMAPYFRSHPIDRKTLINNSVQGFIDLLEKQKGKSC